MLRRVNSCSKSDRVGAHYLEPVRACKNEFRVGPVNERGPISLGGMEESEVVDELLLILVECTKKADLRGQEILLRKFFFEIEKEMTLERFLIERLKQSKISSLFDQRLFRSETETAAEISTTREVKMCEREASEKEKLERFKVKTVQVGVVVKEEKTG